MIRLLLSLLALMSGLVVQGAPAQARLCGNCDTEIGAQASVPAPVNGAVRAAPPAMVARAPVAQTIGLALLLPAAQIALWPRVLIGIDRARQ